MIPCFNGEAYLRRKSGYNFLRFLFVGDELMPFCIEEIDKIAKKEQNISAIAWPYWYYGRNSKVVDRAKGFTNGRYSKEELQKKLEFPFLIISGNCGAYHIDAIRDLQYSEEFIGCSTFLNKMINSNEMYYLDTPLTIFHQKARRTFPVSTTSFYTSEYLLTRNLCLEENKKWLKSKKYKEIKETIIIDAIKDFFKYERGLFIKTIVFYLKVKVKDIRRKIRIY